MILDSKHFFKLNGNQTLEDKNSKNFRLIDKQELLHQEKVTSHKR